MSTTYLSTIIMLFSGFLLSFVPNENLQKQFCCCQASHAFFTVRTFCGVGILLARECKTHHVAMRRCTTMVHNIAKISNYF